MSFRCAVGSHFGIPVASHPTEGDEMPEHKVGTREEWQAARDELAKLEAEQAAHGLTAASRAPDRDARPDSTSFDPSERLTRSTSPEQVPNREIDERHDPHASDSTTAGQAAASAATAARLTRQANLRPASISVIRARAGNYKTTWWPDKEDVVGPMNT